MASSMESGGFMLVSSKHVAVSCQRVAVSQNTAWFSPLPSSTTSLGTRNWRSPPNHSSNPQQKPCTHETSPLPAKQFAYRGKSAERHPEQEFEKNAFTRVKVHMIAAAR